MPKPNTDAVHIQQPRKKQTLSAAQKRFNSLIKKIEKEKQCLQNWLKIKPDVQQKVTTEYEPLLQTYIDLQVALVHRLDEFHDRRSLTGSQKDKISYLICQYYLSLTELQEMDHLEAIFKKHCGIEDDESTDELDEFMSDVMRGMFEEQLGIDLGDDVDFTDPEEVARHIAGKMEEREAEQAHSQQASNQTKRQTAQEKRRLAAEKAEQEKISKSIKAIYRQLITESHPDRESDPDERVRKTEIMQRINTAYEEKNLLMLLEIQLELKQINQDDINTIAQDRLKVYNKILQNQLEQLQEEVKQVEMPFRMSANMPAHIPVNPEKIMCKLNVDIRALADEVNHLEKELKFLTTVKNMKIWLRNGGLAKDTAVPDDLFGMLDDSDIRK